MPEQIVWSAAALFTLSAFGEGLPLFLPRDLL